MRKKTMPTLDKLTAQAKMVWESLRSESDNVVALMGAAYLDDLLMAMLAACCIKDEDAVADLLFDGKFAPLGTLAARTDAAYCLGLVGPNIRDTLDALRDIRNAFSHTYNTITFDSHEGKMDRAYEALTRLVGTWRPMQGEWTRRLLFVFMVDRVAEHLLGHCPSLQCAQCSVDFGFSKRKK